MTEQNKIAMDDIMLAMDVVDTLRRRKALVDHELDADTREQALVEKVKSIYAAQGIEVTDETIAAGVEALRDERFAYHPPPPGLKTRLARMYVNRGTWGKRAGLALTALLAAWGIHFGTVTLPEKQAAREAAEQINQQISHSTLTVKVTQDRLARLHKQLQDLPEVASPTLKNAARSASREAATALDKAGQLLQSARKFGVIDAVSATASDGEKQQTRQQLAQQQHLLKQADAQLDKAQTTFNLLAQMDRLPQSLKEYKQDIDHIAREQKAKTLAKQYYQNAVTALKSGDIKRARIGLSDLKDLLDQLQQAYVLRIVSRPGERSGVWRYPDVNSKARNYYLVVEAIDRSGKKLTLPITSEEDGKTRQVSKWAVRVGASAYNQVAADKKDDGIIQKNKLGIKRRGYLAPEYNVNTSGAAITQW
jgi:hypothetical protein